MLKIGSEAFLAREIISRRVPYWKRAFDISASICLLVIAMPLLILIGLFIKWGSRGPIIFRQGRAGHGGHDFEILKFRTLRVEEEATNSHREYVKSIDRSEPAAKPSLENRLVPGGRWIRAWSLDELPQLINVLRGDMSLVGPRPDVLRLDDYPDTHDLRRFEVLPGITGLWQVSGKNRLSQEEMIGLDIRYVDEHSPSLDFRILLKTLWILLRQDND